MPFNGWAAALQGRSWMIASLISLLTRERRAGLANFAGTRLDVEVPVTQRFIDMELPDLGPPANGRDSSLAPAPHGSRFGEEDHLHHEMELGVREILRPTFVPSGIDVPGLREDVCPRATATLAGDGQISKSRCRGNPPTATQILQGRAHLRWHRSQRATRSGQSCGAD